MKLDSIFTVENPPRLVFSEQIHDSNGINFVSSSGKNEGIIKRVKHNPKNKLYPKESITVPMKGSVLSAFVQPDDFYIAYEIAVLTPMKPMSLSEKIFYCLCIRQNMYRYNFGRQANKTLKDLELPDKIPEFVNEDNFKMVVNTVMNETILFFDKK